MMSWQDGGIHKPVAGFVYTDIFQAVLSKYKGLIPGANIQAYLYKDTRT